MRRVCLLTGAGGTLGEAFCRLYRHKYDIVAVCRERVPDLPSQGQRHRDPLQPDQVLSDNQHPLFTVRADLTEPASIPRVVELALARFGRIDVVVNAAAELVQGSMIQGAHMLSRAEALLQLNVAVPLRLSVEIARAFWRDRADDNRVHNRNIVNVSSLAGVRVYPRSGKSVYGASKAALNFLTAYMAQEFGLIGVRANVVAAADFPSVVPTEVVANAVVSLDDGQGTGTTLVVDRQQPAGAAPLPAARAVADSLAAVG